MTSSDPSAELEARVAAVELLAASALASAGLPADLTRAPRPDELASRTNYAAIDNAVTSATREVLAQAQAARSAVLAAIEDMLVSAASPADVLALLDRVAAGVTTIPGAARIIEYYSTRIEALLRSLAMTASEQVLTDAAAASITARRKVLSDQAVLLIRSQALRLAAEAADSALRAARGAAYSTSRTDVPAAQFARNTLDVARAAETRALPDVAAQVSLRSHGLGRMDGMDGITSPVAYYASELLDRNTCRPCADVDGTNYPDRDAMLADYPFGQYVNCAGAGRCRGTAVAVSTAERPATLPVPYALPTPASPGGIPATV